MSMSALLASSCPKAIYTGPVHVSISHCKCCKEALNSYLTNFSFVVSAVLLILSVRRFHCNGSGLYSGLECQIYGPVLMLALPQVVWAV